MTLLGRALKYGYSNTRVKGMEAKLIDAGTMQRISKAKDVREIIAILYNTDYKDNLIEFGGLNTKVTLLDFAISKNLAEHVEKLVKITPKSDQEFMRVFVSKWDFYNAKLAIEAKTRGLTYDSIASYLIDQGPFSASTIKRAMGKGTDALFEELENASKEYKPIIKKAKDAYEKTRSGISAVNEIDKGEYLLLSEAVEKMQNKHKNAAKIAQLSIDMQNVITMVRAKIAGKTFAEAAQELIKNGTIALQQLEKAYKAKDLQGMLDMLNGEMLGIKYEGESLTKFEISLRRNLLAKAVKLLRNSVLSFATIIAYAYMKELDVISLRLAIKSKQYGLGEEELEKLIG